MLKSSNASFGAEALSSKFYDNYQIQPFQYKLAETFFSFYKSVKHEMKDKTTALESNSSLYDELKSYF